MSQYFFGIRTPAGVLIYDETGTNLVNDQAAIDYAHNLGAHLVQFGDWRDTELIVTDKAGREIFVLPLQAPAQKH